MTNEYSSNNVCKMLIAINQNINITLMDMVGIYMYSEGTAV